MAITATFVARFDNFFDQVNKADAKLGEFAMSAAQTQKGLDRLAASFSGDRIIKDAGLTAKAIEDIGGAAMLTDKEAARVNRTMAEAIEKMQRLGQTVPESWTKLATATQDAGNKTSLYGKITEQVSGIAKTAATAFIGMFAIEKLASFVTGVVNLGGELTDMASKTGLSTTALQQFKYAGGQVGVQLDAITGGINQIQKRLAGDDKSAVAALGALGVSVESFKRLAPEEQFKVIADKVGSIQDPMMRTKAATDLFGKSGTELLPALSKEFGDLTEKANSLGIVMDEQTVAAMDNLGDTVSDLGSVGMAALGRIIGPLIPLLSTLAEAAMKLAGIIGDVLGWAIDKAVGFFKGFANVVLSTARAVVSGMQMTADAIPGMSGAAAALGSALAKIDQAQTALNAKAPETVKATKQVGIEFEATSKSTNKAAEAIKDLAAQLTGKKAAEEVAQLAKAVKAAGGESKITAFEATELAKKLHKYIEAGVKLDPVLASIWLRHQNFNAVGATSIDTLLKLGGAAKQSASDLNSLIPPLQTTSTLSLDKLLSFNAAAGKKAVEQIAKVGELASKGFGDRFGTFMQASLPQSIMSAITGGGNILHAAGSAAGSFLTSKDGLGGTINKGLTAAFGPALGGALNSVVPGLGALMGPLLSKMGSLLGGLFGKVSAEVKQARTDIGAFEDKLAATLTAAQKIEAGGVGWKMTVIAVRDAYLAVGKTAADAEAIVKQLWNDKDPKASKAAMEEINRVLEQQKEKFAALKDLQDELASLQEQNKVSFKDMQETAQKFGIDLAGLGPAFNAARMAEKAKELIDGFETLQRGGADMAVVLSGMSDEVSAFVQESMKLGTTVPENMRPMIEKMIESGQLLDENGEKITDISKIDFGDPVASKFDLIAKQMKEVANKIAELVDVLKVGLVDAAGKAAQGITDHLNAVPKEWNFDVTTRYRGDRNDGESDNGYADGTMGATGSWFKNFGAGTRTTLHGNEAVVRRDQAGAFAAAFGGGQAGMLEELRAMRGDLMALPGHIARATRDAILVAG